MYTFEEFLLWFALVFPLVFSAGPGNVLCAVCGATNGFKKSVPFILGLDLVYTTYSLLIGFGLFSLVINNPSVMTVIQVLGILYIFWLAYKFFSRKSITKKEANPKLRFIDGVISQALNIKGVTIVITMYSQFLNKDGNIIYEVLTLSLALLILNLFTHFTWVYCGAWMSQKFASNYAVEIQSKIFGLMLIIVAFFLSYKIVL